MLIENSQCNHIRRGVKVVEASQIPEEFRDKIGHLTGRLQGPYVLIDEQFDKFWEFPVVCARERIITRGDQFVGDIRVDFDINKAERSLCRVCGKHVLKQKFATEHYQKSPDCWREVSRVLQIPDNSTKEYWTDGTTEVYPHIHSGAAMQQSQGNSVGASFTPTVENSNEIYFLCARTMAAVELDKFEKSPALDESSLIFSKVPELSVTQMQNIPSVIIEPPCPPVIPSCTPLPKPFVFIRVICNPSAAALIAKSLSGQNNNSNTNSNINHNILSMNQNLTGGTNSSVLLKSEHQSQYNVNPLNNNNSGVRQNSNNSINNNNHVGGCEILVEFGTKLLVRATAFTTRDLLPPSSSSSSATPHSASLASHAQFLNIIRQGFFFISVPAPILPTGRFEIGIRITLSDGTRILNCSSTPPSIDYVPATEYISRSVRDFASFQQFIPFATAAQQLAVAAANANQAVNTSNPANPVGIVSGASPAIGSINQAAMAFSAAVAAQNRMQHAAAAAANAVSPLLTSNARPSPGSSVRIISQPNLGGCPAPPPLMQLSTNCTSPSVASPACLGSILMGGMNNSHCNNPNMSTAAPSPNAPSNSSLQMNGGLTHNLGNGEMLQRDLMIGSSSKLEYDYPPNGGLSSNNQMNNQHYNQNNSGNLHHSSLSVTTVPTDRTNSYTGTASVADLPVNITGSHQSTLEGDQLGRLCMLDGSEVKGLPPPDHNMQQFYGHSHLPMHQQTFHHHHHHHQVGDAGDVSGDGAISNLNHQLGNHHHNNLHNNLLPGSSSANGLLFGGVGGGNDLFSTLNHHHHVISTNSNQNSPMSRHGYSNHHHHHQMAHHHHNEVGGGASGALFGLEEHSELS